MKQKPSLKARALRFLASREHSAWELTAKLKPYAEETDDIESLIQWLQEKGFLSEERFAETYARHRAARYGSRKILYDLQNHQLPSSVMQEITETLEETELQRAFVLWERKFGKPPETLPEKAKQIRFLQQRGFPGNIIRQVIKGDLPDFEAP
ncbi:MAG: recombination regulator RecX [Oxalobacter sp.]|nr:recombination regulator RecX [Oxalobacter sp.]